MANISEIYSASRNYSSRVMRVICIRTSIRRVRHGSQSIPLFRRSRGGHLTSCFRPAPAASFVAVARNEAVYLKCPCNERQMYRRRCSSRWNVSVSTTFSTPCILALLHRANMRATCSYVMTLCGCPSSLHLARPRRAFVGPLYSHARGTDIVADLVPPRMRTCNYLDTLSPCRNYIFSAIEGTARNLDP